ncbi:MAG: prolipoprotein diacylglyceryl transferase [Ignavibacteriaceae bacterium]|nr:prolipoprotein diacylglyceryl transferase [Ignavibacteriaceae bacterium]
MYPILFKIGPLNVYSYGVLLVIAFIVGYYFFWAETRRKKLDRNIAGDITVIAVFCGIIGSKLLYILENLNLFLTNPFQIALSPNGFTYFGGLILAFFCSWIYIRKRKFNFLEAADAVGPSLIIAYGIGRIGCHLSGDGDYGIPTSLPWGTNYENGIVPPSRLFNGTDYALIFPNQIFPDNTPLHPTPIYEFISSFIIFLILWKFRKANWTNGKLTMLYLILSSIARFFIEFFRINPKIFLGFSEAQIISSLILTIGLLGFIYLSKTKVSIL